MVTDGGTYVRCTYNIHNRKTPGLSVTVGQRSKPRLLGQNLFGNACEPSRQHYAKTRSPSTEPQEPRERLNSLHMGPPLWSHPKKIHVARVGCMEKSMYSSSRTVVWVDPPPRVSDGRQLDADGVGGGGGALPETVRGPREALGGAMESCCVGSF